MTFKITASDKSSDFNKMKQRWMALDDIEASEIQDSREKLIEALIYRCNLCREEAEEEANWYFWS